VFILGTLEKAGFWTIWVCSCHPNSKSVLACLGRAPHVPFLPLSGSDWKTSSSLLLLVKGEFPSHVSLSESSLKLPPSVSESFKISLILSGQIKFLWTIFWTRTQSRIFHIACDARNIIWLVRPHWYFRPTCLERGHNDSLHLIAGVNCNKTKTWIESNVKTACWQPFPRESPAYTLIWLAGRWTVTGTTHMGESNGTNLKPIPMILFFNKLMKIGMY